MKIARNIVTAIVLLLPLSLFAQSNEFSVFESTLNIQSTSLADDPAITVDIEFDGQPGFGVGYNRYWTEHFSTEVAVQKLTADTKLVFSGPAVSATFDAGDVDLTTISGIAQWHFGAGRWVPYAGGGIVHVSGSANGPDDPTDPTSPVTKDDLESKTSFIANAGIDFRITPRIALSLDGRYFSYDAVAEDDPRSEAISLDSTVLSVAVKFRF